MWGLCLDFFAQDRGKKNLGLAVFPRKGANGHQADAGHALRRDGLWPEAWDLRSVVRRVGSFVMQAAAVAWINSFEENPFKCGELKDLADGVLFYNVLTSVEPKYFPKGGVTGDCKGDSQLRVGNLQRLKSCLESYFQDLLDEPQSLEVDALLVAKGDDTDAILCLFELVLMAAIQSDSKQQVVENIMGLSESYQQRLMVVCEAVMSRFQSGDINARNGKPSLLASPASKSAEDPDTSGAGDSFMLSSSKSLGMDALSSPSEVGRLRARIEKLSKQIAEYKLQNNELTEASKALKREIVELKRQEAERRASAGKDDAKISELRRQVQTLRRDRTQLAETLEDERSKAASLESAAQQVGGLKKTISKLQDELDVARSKSTEFAIAKSQIDRYKKKLAEFEGMHKRLKDADAVHTRDLERIFQLEDQLKERGALRDKLAKAKSLATEREAEVDQLRKRAKDADEAAERERRKAESLEGECEQLKRGLADLKEENAVLLAQADGRDSAAAPAVGGGASLGLDALDTSGPSKEETMRMEREIASLRQRAEAGAESKREAEALREKVRGLETALEEAGAAASAETRKLEDGNAALRRDLDAARKAASASAARPDAEIEIKALKARLAASEERANRSEKALQKRDQQVEVLRQSADQRRGADNAAEKMKTKMSLMEEQQIKLARTNANLKAQLDKSAKALGKERLTIRSLREEARKTGSGRYARELKQEIDKLKTDIKSLNAKRQSERESYKREQLIMSSAFYSIGMEAHNSFLNSGPARSSLLATQRAKAINGGKKPSKNTPSKRGPRTEMSLRREQFFQRK